MRLTILIAFVLASRVSSFSVSSLHTSGYISTWHSPNLHFPQRRGRQNQLISYMAQPTVKSGQKTLTLVDGIRDIVDDYDVFLLDMWGVMHDGFNAYDGVIECVQKLRDAGKRMIILSNSSQRTDKSIKNLEGLGFQPKTDFEQIITSGQVSFLLLSDATDEELRGCKRWDVLTMILNKNRESGSDNKVFVLGSEEARDVPYVKACGWKFAPIAEADLILCKNTLLS